MLFLSLLNQLQGEKCNAHARYNNSHRAHLEMDNTDPTVQINSFYTIYVVFNQYTTQYKGRKISKEIRK